jgi:hypothetical protein
MSYTKLTSFQFERGTGFTEESVLAFRSLVLTAVDELVRSTHATTATFPLSAEELHLIIEHRSSAQSTAPSPVVVKEPDPEPDLEPESEQELEPDLEPESEQELEPKSTFDEWQEVGVPLAADSHEAVHTPADSVPTSLIPAAAAAHIASDPAHAGPPDDDFAAAARWLALATRDDTEPYRPSLGR